MRLLILWLRLCGVEVYKVKLSPWLSHQFKSEFEKIGK